MLVKKNDGSNRICVDYRKLNRVIVTDPAPMTPMETLRQEFSDDRYFMRLDLPREHWQISVVKDDVERTAFLTQDRHYEFLRMLFGMKNSGATLCRCMDKILADCPNAKIYVDDILVHTQTWVLHGAVLRKVFGRFCGMECPRFATSK